MGSGGLLHLRTSAWSAQGAISPAVYRPQMPIETVEFRQAPSASLGAEVGVLGNERSSDSPYVQGQVARLTDIRIHSGMSKSYIRPDATPPDRFPPLAPDIVADWPVAMKKAYGPGLSSSDRVIL